MLTSLFENLKPISVDLYNVGRKVEILFYTHPEESLANMRKFAEGALIYYLQRVSKRSTHYSGLGELLNEFVFTKYFDRVIYSDFKAIQHTANASIHFTSNQKPITIEDINKNFRCCYNIAKWLYEFVTKEKDFPEFTLPNKYFVIQENTINHNWFSYYLQRRVQIERQDAASKKWISILSASCGHKQTEHLNQSNLILELISKHSINHIILAICLITIKLFLNANNSDLIKAKLCKLVLHSIDNDAVRYAQSALKNEDSKRIMENVRFLISSDSFFDINLINSILNTYCKGVNANSEAYVNFYRYLVEKHLLNLTAEFVFNLYARYLQAMVGLLSKGIIEAWLNNQSFLPYIEDGDIDLAGQIACEIYPEISDD